MLVFVLGSDNRSAANSGSVSHNCLIEVFLLMLLDSLFWLVTTLRTQLTFCSCVCFADSLAPASLLSLTTAWQQQEQLQLQQTLQDKPAQQQQTSSGLLLPFSSAANNKHISSNNSSTS